MQTTTRSMLTLARVSLIAAAVGAIEMAMAVGPTVPASGPQSVKPRTCAERINSAKELTEDLAVQFPWWIGISKNEFEKQAEFEARKRVKLKEFEADGVSAAARIGTDLKLTVQFFSSYNADTETLTGTIVPFQRPAEIAEKKATYTSLTKPSGNPTRTAGQFGSVRESTSSVGVLYKTKLRDPAVKGTGNFSHRIARDVARASKDNMAMVVVGKPMSPWSHFEVHRSTDYGRVSETASSTRSVVMEVDCAAIVDKQTGQVVYEFK